MDFVTVANVNDVKEGKGKVVEANGKTIALFNVDGKIYAIDNTCVHAGGPLGEGTCEGNVVTCPWHGWKFDVTTGISPVNPQAKVDTFEVQIEGEEVKVKTE
jgi:nitrite reductase/ring-hydroxylating ferredoxin subunit